MRKNLLDEIKLAIESKAKTEGYALVIDTGAQTYAADPSGPYYTPTLLYWTENSDLTEAVISQLNVAAPVETPRAGEKPGDVKSKK
jgi:Skp family chaperone for outer membrane proteins